MTTCLDASPSRNERTLSRQKIFSVSLCVDAVERNEFSVALQGLLTFRALNRNPERSWVLLYLRELSVSSSQPAQTLMEEGVDLVLLHRAGQVQRGERASVVVTACAREGERHHRSLLPL